MITVLDAHVVSLSWPGCSRYPRGRCNFTPRPTTYACTLHAPSPTEDRNPTMKIKQVVMLCIIGYKTLVLEVHVICTDSLLKRPNSRCL